MGNEAEDLTPEEQDEENARLEAEATAKAAEEATEKEKAEAEAEELAKAEAEETEAKIREDLEADGKTPEEIEEAIEKSRAEGAELEIVRDGETQPKFSQQQLDSVVTKRIARLNKKKLASDSDAATANTDLEVEKEKNKLLALRIEQLADKQTEIKAPDPEDFEDGRDDAGFIKKSAEYTSQLISQEVAKQVAEAQQVTTQTEAVTVNTQELEEKQLKHYKRATDIGAKDYEETEDKALDILGTDFANQIINNFDDAHILFYYMGKNPMVAQAITEQLKASPIMGVAELGRLSSQLKLKPKTKIAPDPDKDIQGDNPPKGKRGPKGATYS